MSGRCIRWALAISIPVWVLVIIIISAWCELPEGMHLANEVRFIPCALIRNDSLGTANVMRFDTVVFRPYSSPALDSLRRMDSMKAGRRD
jgi:hypothetical protein